MVGVVLLLMSSLEHLTNPFRFLDGIMAYQLVSFSAAKWVAMILPGVALMAALSMCSQTLRPAALVITAFLGLLFLTVQSTAIVRDLTVSCGCFDPFRSETVSPKTLLFPASLCLSSILCFWLEQRQHDPNTR